MSRLHALSVVVLTGCLFPSLSADVAAQSDADVALQKAREAYQAEQFETARDQAKTASQTDPGNPDVWLLLGKAHFQLGELDDALIVWRRLLKLAPAHEYGRRMVSALEGRISDVDVRIRLAAVNVGEGFTKTARTELQSLRSRSSLTDEQLRKVLLLLGEVSVLEGNGTEALALVNELTTRQPDTAATVPVRLLTARAQVVIGGDLTTFGLQGFEAIVEEAADTADGKIAALELLLHRISQGENVVAEVAAWVGENAASSASRRARVAVRDSVQRFLVTSAAKPAPKADAELNDDDKSALAAAGHAFKAFVNVSDQIALAQAITTHLEKRYLAADAFAAARSGLAQLGQLELSDAVREVVTASGLRVDEAEATFEYLQLLSRVTDGTAAPAALSEWIEQHADHPKELDARRALVLALLDVTRRQDAPEADAELSESDRQALAAAGELIAKLESSDEISKLIETLTQHFQKHYFERRAHDAAIAGVTALIPLEVPVRRAALNNVLKGMRDQIAAQEYARISKDVGVAIAGPDDLAKWIADNAGHPNEVEARQALVTAYLNVTRRQDAPEADAELSESDKKALAAAGELIKLLDSTDEATKLIQTLTQHFQKHYFERRAHDAAIAGVTALIPLEVPVRRAALNDVLKGMREQIAALEYMQINRDVSETIASPDDLAKWIADNAGHPKELEARRTLVFAYLNVTRRQSAPARDAKLSEADTKALAAAGELLPKIKDASEVDKIANALMQHFENHYYKRGAHAAAIEGIKATLTLYADNHRLPGLQKLLELQRQVAVMELQQAVAAGKIPAVAAPLPASVQAAVDTAGRISTDYPSTPAWKTQAELAKQVLDVAGSVPWPTQVTGPKAGHGWALAVALPVVKANADGESVALARTVIDLIVNELAALTQPTAAGLATATHEQLLALLGAEHPLWVDVTLRHVDLLTADVNREFDANVQSGGGVKNAKLTETQEQILSLLTNVVKQRPAAAAVCLQKLGTMLQKWSAARHDEVVESSYATFAADLPPVTQRQTRLALARLWFNQVLRSHSRILASGFQVPRELDARAQKSLEECYRLASVLGLGDPLLADIRALRMQIIDHYLALKFEDIAEAAIKVKVDPANADLDEQAELELAGLQRRLAERRLAQQLKRHDGRKQIVLTPAFNEAIAALKKFITDHPASQRVSTAADGVFVIGRRFEQYEAWEIAAQIYVDFEQFAADIDALKQSRPGQSTYPERAAMARATALHTRASKALQEWNTSKPDDAPIPNQLSDEFQAAQAAWQKVIADYQQRPVAQTAISRIMAIAQEYAGIGAWDVADATYGALLGLELPLRSPERLEFGRAICQLGKVLPEHARTVLAALAVTGATSPGDDDEAGERVRGSQLIGSLWKTESQLNRPGSRDPAGNVTAGPPPDIPVAEAPPAASAPVATGSTPAPQPQVSSATRAEADDAAPADPFGVPAQGLPGGGLGGGVAGFASRANEFRAKSDAQLMAALRTHLDRQAKDVAMLRDETIRHRRQVAQVPDEERESAQGEGQSGGGSGPAVAVLSEAELQRQQEVLDAVYTALQALRQKYAESPTAGQARDEIFVMVNHWREIAQWDRAAKLARRFLTDNPTDIELPKIRQDIARDWLAWASMGVRDPELDREELLAEISSRFDTARDELQAIIAAFPDETAVRHQAQWDIANSFLTQARVVASSSPTLARGQFVRATTELLRVAELFHDHPQIGSIPNMLWGISNELAARSYHDEAITVWNELRIHYPTHTLADQSAMRIAQTWQQLGQPLRAVEAFLELNFARGGSDADLQNTIYGIASNLKNQKRWIESLHVLQTFVDSFPSHANSGQALTMIGQIHQSNEVWEDAIAAYGRVIDEFATGNWTTEARWSIAECTINLSLWQEAIGAYADFQRSYPEDGRVAEATRRIEVLKTLSRYQDVIDEEGQRKAFDAQFQVASIVHAQLANPVKAVIEYRKVAQNWPTSHLADDALYEIGKIYLDRGETELARAALLEAAEKYPTSPLADDALLLVGRSYVAEADRLAAVDRSKSQEIAKDIAQKQAYKVVQDNRRRQMMRNLDQIAQLKKAGKAEEAANKEAYFAGQALQFDQANTLNASNWAAQQEEVLSAAQLADRQDKMNAALRKAVQSFRKSASVAAADKADDALLQMAQIYDERLKDSDAALSTWEEIVKQYSGTEVAEDASWKMAKYYETSKEHTKAIAAYQAFFRNYRRSPRAGQAQTSIAENHERLGNWVQAMDAYTNYLNNFPEGPLVKKARDQINWIKTYRL